MNRMQKSVIYIPILIICIFLTGCATAPVTGRSQLLLVPENDEIALGLKSYQEVLAKSKISHDQQVNAQVSVLAHVSPGLLTAKTTAGNLQSSTTPKLPMPSPCRVVKLLSTQVFYPTQKTITAWPLF